MYACWRGGGTESNPCSRMNVPGTAACQLPTSATTVTPNGHKPGRSRGSLSTPRPRTPAAATVARGNPNLRGHAALTHEAPNCRSEHPQATTSSRPTPMTLARARKRVKSDGGKCCWALCRRDPVPEISRADVRHRRLRTGPPFLTRSAALCAREPAGVWQREG